MTLTDHLVKTLLFISFFCSLFSVLVCRDLTNYLVIILLFATFICVLQSKQKFYVPRELFLIISASFFYIGVAILNNISISFGITILLYSFLATTLSIVSTHLGLVNIINRIFPLILILIIAEYIILLFGGGSFLNSSSCDNPAVSNYRLLHNITSASIGMPHIRGLNSIFLGAQSASLFLVLSIFWFLRKARENANIIDYSFLIISVTLLILSPTVTGAILFFTGCILYIFLFNVNIRVGPQTIGIIFSIFLICLYLIYLYIDIQHNFYFLFTDTVIDPINRFSEIHFSKILVGLGTGYSDYLISNEIALLALMLMYGLLGYSIFLFLFILLPMKIGINFERSDRIYILIILLLFISLIHYNASIRGGFLFLYITFLSVVFGKLIYQKKHID